MEISAGTSSWPSRISHFTGSFVGHSPSEMLCPPAWKLKINHEESNQTSSAPKSTERSFTSIQMAAKKKLITVPLGLWGIMSLKLYPSQHIRHWNSEALNSLITPLSTTTQSPLRTIGPYDTGAGDPEWPVELMQGRAIRVDRCFTLSLWISTLEYIHIEIW